MSEEQKYNICLVCDFFYPRLGGVEMHIYQLGQCLIERGHKVIVVTHGYGNRQGVRYMTNGLKAYYCPLTPFADQDTWPTFYGFFRLFRNILIRERIDIVHAHQATSVLGHECLLHAKTMGYKAVYTDHSLFGFSDAACIHINKVMKFYLSDVDHAICVSHTNRENLVLRASLNPYNSSTIPNAVDSARFTPDPSQRNPLNTVNVVVVSRLTYRKGVDLLIDVIPAICKKYPQVHFIIGGDGPKKILIEQMRDKNYLQDRIELLGSIPHKQVRDVMVRGHIFLNTSLTEAFCIAIVEAACSGLLVVSTSVGGVVEVLPPHMRHLAKADPQAMITALEAAIPQANNFSPQEFHEEVKQMYSWRNVAERTEKVYNKISKNETSTVVERLKRYRSAGPFAGLIFCLIVLVDYIVYAIISWLDPSENIDIAPTFPYEEYVQTRAKYCHDDVHLKED